MRTRQHIISLIVVAAFTLTGCGTQSMGTLATAPVSKAASAKAAGAIVTVTHGKPEAPGRQHTPLKTSNSNLPELVIHGQYEMSEEALANDAESEGYSIMAADKDSEKGKLEQKFTKTGIVRRSETGFVFEASNGLFKAKKKATVFTLTGSPEFMTMIADRENKKAQIKGTVDKDNVVTVTSVKGLADLGFLTNWFSKGKITGKVVDKGTGLPLAGTAISAKSTDGFVLKALSEADGTYEIKNCTPGTYLVSFSRDGYVSLKDSPVEVAKRKSTDSTAKLPAEIVVEEPTATPSN